MGLPASQTERVNEYGKFHQDAGNLLIHIVAVPLFIACAFGFVWALFHLAWLRMLGCIAGMALAMAAQAYGHKRETNPPLPFKGPAQFLTRIFSEQLYKFPLFVLSGAWFRALRLANETDVQG